MFQRRGVFNLKPVGLFWLTDRTNDEKHSRANIKEEKRQKRFDGARIYWVVDSRAAV